MNRNRPFLFLVVALVVLLQAFGTLSQDVSIVASPTTLEHSKDNVTIAWKGVPNPTSTDVITIHSPANQSDWIGFVFVTSASTWASGSGEIVMPLVNDRYDYGFKYWSNYTGTEVLLAESNSIGFANPNEPLQGHIQLTDDPTEMRVMWVSGTQSGALVKYGLESGKYTNQSTAVNSTTYTTSQLCDAPANLPQNFRFPGYIHDALLTGLELSTKYYYVFGSDADGWSQEFNFVTSPGVGADTELEFFVYGDMGTSFPFYIQNDPQPPAEWTTHWVHHYINNRLNNLPGLILHIGDISYARGLAFIWDWFFDLIEKVATKVPYMVAIGNHEYDYAQQPWKPSWSPYGNDSAGECGTPYYARFHTPSPTYYSLLNYSNVTPRNLWYSFEMGPVHFTIVSTETDFLEGSEQYNFIKADLASVDRSRTPWLVFTGHRPMYTSSVHPWEEALDMNLQITFEPLFKEFDVDVCFWGHVHTYERTCGMYNQTCVGNDNDAPVHIIVGNAGNLYQAPWDATPPNSYFHIQPDWDIFRTSNYGFGRVHANRTHFVFDLIGDVDGGVHDHMVLTK